MYKYCNKCLFFVNISSLIKKKYNILRKKGGPKVSKIQQALLLSWQEDIISVSIINHREDPCGYW